LTSPGTAANPVRVICVNDGAEPPTTLATTASVATTQDGNGRIELLNFAYYYGLSFLCGPDDTSSGANSITFLNNNSGWIKCEQCTFHLRRNDDSDTIATGNNSSGNAHAAVEWVNCHVR